MKIELCPADALRIHIFLEEHREEMENIPEFECLKLAANSFRDQVYKMTNAEIDDGIAEIKMAQLLGKEPG